MDASAPANERRQTLIAVQFPRGHVGQMGIFPGTTYTASSTIKFAR